MNSKSRRVDHRQALLASLSSAGIALVAGSDAQAGIIVSTVDQDVGWVKGVQTADFIGNLPGFYGRNSINIRASNGSSSRSLRFKNIGSVYVKANGGTSPYGHGAIAVIAEKGQKWDQIGPGFEDSRAHIAYNSTGGHASGLSPFTNKFFAFKFNDGTSSSYQFRYGWIKASLTNQSFSNLFLHIDSYAYDDSGAQIAMGATGVPEPASAIQLAALAALTWARLESGAGKRRRPRPPRRQGRLLDGPDRRACPVDRLGRGRLEGDSPSARPRSNASPCPLDRGRGQRQPRHHLPTPQPDALDIDRHGKRPPKHGVLGFAEPLPDGSGCPPGVLTEPDGQGNLEYLEPEPQAFRRGRLVAISAGGADRRCDGI